MSKWRETLKKTLPLAYFLDEAYPVKLAVTVIPRNVHNCIYIVKTEAFNDLFDIHYIGMTRNSLHDRLLQHISSGTPLGQFIAVNMPHSYHFLIDVILVRGDILMAEKDTIKSMSPILNKQHNGIRFS